MKQLCIKFLLMVILVFTVIISGAMEVKHTISGYIKDKNTGETLIGANVYVKELKTGAAANLYGFYSLSIPKGDYTLVYSYIGYEQQEIKISLTENKTLNIDMSPTASTMKEVVIVGKKENENITNTEMSVFKLDNKTISKIPVLMGESDLIKSIQLLPGVQSACEGSSGYNVRGGSADQNLILLDEATVYNASHLMGFFSVFNSDAIKDVKLYKGDIPPAFGGRLSSLLDVRMKDGNNKKFQANGGIGIIASRLTVEGPIVKEKSSFMISGRRTYFDLFLPLFEKKDSLMSKSRLYFYDLNLKINYDINKNNRVYVSGYFGRDMFRFSDEFNFQWGNNTETVRWNHLFGSKMFSNLTLLYSEYTYELGTSSGTPRFKWTSNLKDLGLKYDFNYYLNTSNTIKFGTAGTVHYFNPGVFSIKESNLEYKLPKTNALEYAFYINNEQKLGALVTVDYGMRYSIFQNMGKATLNRYDNNYNYRDSVVYGRGEIYNTYSGLEPRLSTTFLINEYSAIKCAYSRTMQYVQLATNSTGGSPLDVWFPASPNVKPQISDQFNAGYFRNLNKNAFEASIEAYYKKMKNQVDFKDFANLLLNDKMDGELRFGDAWSYGTEMMIKKNTGNITGWLSYTLSRAEKKINGINDNKKYLANYDHTHNVSIVLSYAVTKRIDFSANWVYVTGSPTTLPTGRFYYGNAVIPVYSDKNAARMPDYHRLDVGVTFKGKEKPGKRFYNELNLSVYNVYNRKNPYSIFFQADENNPQQMQGYKMSMFPIVPSITYNFRY